MDTDTIDGDIAEAIIDAFNAGVGHTVANDQRDEMRRIWITHRFLTASGLSPEASDFGESAVPGLFASAVNERTGYGTEQIRPANPPAHLYVVGVYDGVNEDRLIATVHLALTRGLAVWGDSFEHQCTLALGADYVADSVYATVADDA